LSSLNQTLPRGPLVTPNGSAGPGATGTTAVAQTPWQRGGPSALAVAALAATGSASSAETGSHRIFHANRDDERLMRFVSAFIGSVPFSYSLFAIPVVDLLFMNHY